MDSAKTPRPLAETFEAKEDYFDYNEITIMN